MGLFLFDLKKQMVDKIYCINLDRRPDRWELARHQFAKHGLTVERFPGIDTKDFKKQYPCDNANNGCSLSHYFISEKAKFLGLESIMVFEDDCELHDSFNVFLQMCFEHLPADWDILYLGGSHKEKPVPVNNLIYRVTKTLTTHAYILRNTMFQKVIESVPSLTDPIDCYFVNWQKEHNVYVTNPPLAWQRGGFSDIVGREMHYDWIKSNDQ